MSTDKKNLHQRINEVRKAIGYIQKDKSVSAGAGGNYKAATHDAVTGLVRQHLVEQGIVIIPSVVNSVFHPKEGESKQRLYEAHYLIRFVNMDEPADAIEVQMTAHALDNGDKAPGKAISYATKYAILKLFNIETGEDEESRYQVEEFDLAGAVVGIREALTMDDLKSVYDSAYRETLRIKDREGQKRIIAEKEKRKKEIQQLDTAGQA